MIINKRIKAAAVIFWTSKKIICVVLSSLAAETFGLQQMTDMLQVVRKLLEGMIGDQAKCVPCVALWTQESPEQYPAPAAI